MRRRTLADWIRAVRPWSFPASAMPVAVATCCLWWQDGACWLMGGVWAAACIVLFHAAANLWSDWRDWRTGVDHAGADCVPTLVTGLFTPREVLSLAAALLLAAVAGGLALAARAGAELLFIGLAGLVAAAAYPELKRHALGDFAIFLAYAVLPVVGTSYIVTEQAALAVLFLIPPVGLITVAILHANNMRDVLTDRQSGVRTVAMRLGLWRSMRLYAFEVLFPYVWLAGCAASGVFPAWTLLAFLSLPLAAGNVRGIRRALRRPGGSVAGIDQRTALLQLLFSLLLAASFVAARLSGAA